MKPLHILHCHSTFSLGGKEARAVQLMNAFGDAAAHVILSAVPDALGARAAIDPTVKVDFPGEAAPPLYGKPGPLRYRRLSKYMQQFDLVLTYNWGSMDAVGARWMFPAGCPPIIHHEDGFNADEAVRLNWKRNAFRRLMLPSVAGLVVVSNRLREIALTEWRQPASKIVQIANGIETSLYAGAPQLAAIPGLERDVGDIVVGTLAGLRAVKNLPRLVRAVAPLPQHVKLVIVGEGPERAAILAEAERLGMAGRIILPGFLMHPHTYVGHFDIFALSSDSEQFPISLVEAMAAGKPAVSTDVGDVRNMVASENLFAIETDEVRFAANLQRLVADAALRKSVGLANQGKAARSFDAQSMIAQYRHLYWETAQKNPRIGA